MPYLGFCPPASNSVTSIPDWNMSRTSHIEGYADSEAANSSRKLLSSQTSLARVESNEIPHIGSLISPDSDRLSSPHIDTLNKADINRSKDSGIQPLPTETQSKRMPSGTLTEDKTATHPHGMSFASSTSREHEGKHRPNGNRILWMVRSIRAYCGKRSTQRPESRSRPSTGVSMQSVTEHGEEKWKTDTNQHSMVSLPNVTTVNLDQAGDRTSQQNDLGAVTGSTRASTGDDSVAEYPSPYRLAILLVGVSLAVFLVSLDRTIITTAIPKITADFRSYHDIGWYGSSYLITACSLQPLYGRVYTKFDIKWSFLVAVGIFAVGSLICALAPTSSALIIGRATTGCGSAGILTGAFVVVANSVPMHKRPVLTAIVSMMFGIGATIGPLIGGVFTDLVSWRWCFWINIPVAVLNLAAMLFCFKPQSKRPALQTSFRHRLADLDLIGSCLLLAGFCQLFLSLQFNVEGHAWASKLVLGPLLGSVVTLGLFLLWQRHQGDRALMPPKIMLQRSVAASCFFSFFLYAALLVHAYYLPIWFQAIQSASAINSGVRMIAYMVSNAFFCLFASVVVSKVGYFTPVAVIGCAIGIAGSALFSTLKPSTAAPAWAGFEVLAAAGFGLAIQQGVIAVQSVLDLKDVPIGVAAVTAFQSLGGAVFLTVGNDVLQNELLRQNVPGVDVGAVIAAGATQFRHLVDPKYLPALVEAYNMALQKTFVVAIPLAVLALIGTLGLEWKNIAQTKPEIRGDEERAECGNVESGAETKTADEVEDAQIEEEFDDGKTEEEVENTNNEEEVPDIKPREEFVDASDSVQLEGTLTGEEVVDKSTTADIANTDTANVEDGSNVSKQEALVNTAETSISERADTKQN